MSHILECKDSNNEVLFIRKLQQCCAVFDFSVDRSWKIEFFIQVAEKATHTIFLRFVSAVEGVDPLNL